MKKIRTLIALLCCTILLSGCALFEFSELSEVKNTVGMIKDNYELVVNVFKDAELMEQLESDGGFENLTENENFLTLLNSLPNKNYSDIENQVSEFGAYPYATLNDNYPEFTDEEMKITDTFEYYSNLDSLGRCGVAFANICTDIMPTEPRGEIGHIKPSGWHTVKYNDIIDGNYLYNRCHLIGFQLAGENDNEKNLITGTRYMNVEGMLPFENMIDDYVEATNNHVLYRVTPIYDGDDLVAKGVQMEAFSIEDNGEGICFNVFAYNAQPGIEIDYTTGESKLKE